MFWKSWLSSFSPVFLLCFFSITCPLSLMWWPMDIFSSPLSVSLRVRLVSLIYTHTQTYTMYLHTEIKCPLQNYEVKKKIVSIFWPLFIGTYPSGDAACLARGLEHFGWLVSHFRVSHDGGRAECVRVGVRRHVPLKTHGLEKRSMKTQIRQDTVL